jgi:hypothetical protein
MSGTVGGIVGLPPVEQAASKNNPAQRWMAIKRIFTSTEKCVQARFEFVRRQPFNTDDLFPPMGADDDLKLRLGNPQRRRQKSKQFGVSSGRTGWRSDEPNFERAVFLNAAPFCLLRLGDHAQRQR